MKKTKEECDTIIESGVCRFTIGEDLGVRLMEIAMEHLTERNNPVQALKTITDSLIGCPTELAVKILKGDVVLWVDVKNQDVIPMKRTEMYGKLVADKIFPKVDPCYWIEKRHQDIETHGENLIQGFKYLQTEIRKNNKCFTVDFPYDDIFKFVSGKDESILEYLRDNYCEVDAIANLIETTKKYVEFSMSIQSTMDWMVNTFDEFSNPILYAEYNGKKGDCSQMLTDVMFVMKETLNFEFEMWNVEENDSVTKYIESAKEIDAIVEKGIEPVDMMSNWSAGWLAPNGDYYGLNGEIANMLHIQIATALQEISLIPIKNNDGDDLVDVNADAWLEQQGWAKIHGANVQFAGCLNKNLGSKNVNLTKAQIEAICKYIAGCHNGVVKLGWRLTPTSIAKFEMLANDNPEHLNKTYFEF